MSMHAGVRFFDGRPAEDANRSLVARLGCLAPERVWSVTEPGVSMACSGRAVWTHEAADRQPLRSASGFVMTWDGRLDNRDDLCRQLGAVPLEESDAAIALAVFERHGVDGLRSLVGDWSLAAWDSASRTLYLARDYMGVRPLYYCADGRAVSWSSSLGELATRTGRADDLDETFVAGLMAFRLSTDVTPYRGIRAVPCAQCVCIGPAGEETRRRFWRLEPATIRYRDPRNYEEHLRGIWAQAVGARLRTDGAVWAELSGGLDSSSVVCMADALVKERRVAASAIRPVSHVAFDSPEGDERTFIKEVEARTGVTSTILGVEQHEDLRTNEDWVTPLAARGIQVASERHVGEHSGRVILSGRLGDLVMGCTTDNSVAVFDDLAGWDIGAALSKMRLWSRASKKPFVEIGWSLAREARSAASGRVGRSLNAAQQAGIDLLAPSLRPLALAFTPADVPGVRWSTRRFAESIAGYTHEGKLEDPSSDPRVSYSYPYSHRPLVEYMLAIPAEELSAPGTPRSLMRRAFAGIVPDRILRRRSKGCYPPAIMRAVRRRLASLPPPDQFEIVRRGWFDENRLTNAIRIVTQGGSQIGGELQFAVLLEDWLIARNRRGLAASQEREEVTCDGVRIA